MKTVSLIQMFTMSLFFAGCITHDDIRDNQTADDHTGESAQQVTGVASPSSAPVPIASLKLTSGHVVEFYDFGEAALIVESGAAYTSPTLDLVDTTPPDQLASIWTHLAPETPVPPALEALQRRLMSLPVDAAATKVLPSSSIRGERATTAPARIGDPRTVLPSAPVGCNNGCCDSAWLSTLAECQGGGWNYSWFLYNYLWTFANTSNNITYQGLVCSAQGTSTFSVNIGGSGGTWSVPEATFRWFHWVAGRDFFGFNIPKNMSSSVNSSSNPHLHTYCGRVVYD